ncbi:hypothetical protein H0H87_009696 [Tephrocybe sp. NHM501043]|nr:hypothetical protein H0H87_009696 [Tephrocybe sp. NHM501043]
MNLISFFRRRFRQSSYASPYIGIDEKETTHTVPVVPKTAVPASCAQCHGSVKQVVSNTFVFALSLVEKLAECAPVPGLKGAVGAFHVVMQRFEDSEQNLGDFDDLVTAIDSFNDILSKFEDTSVTGRGLTDDLGEQLFMLSGELKVIKDQVNVIKGHNRLRRMIEASHDAHAVSRGFRRLQGFINEIVVGSALKAEARLADLWALEHLNNLPRARDALHDYINRPMCSEGTREGVLKQIMRWVKNENGHQIYWLNGGAGTGKTTIALTVADMLAKDPTIFSASFFCSRESESRSDARLIFPTFAYLFVRCDVQLRNRIVRVIRESPDIGHALPKEQLTKLLVKPLRRVYTSTQRPIVLVLDALDECTGGRAPETILTALALEIKLVPFLKVFVSSRSNASTNDAFSNKALRQRREVFVLHDVEKDVVDADIRDYMMERLTKKATLRQISTHPPWPPPELVGKLVRMAGGLFIFASTVCEFIEARGDLEFRLKEITARPVHEYTGIDGLYREILEYAIAQFPGQTTVDHCRSIIGTIILLQDPLSSYDISQLLHLPPKHIQGILGDLQSVLSVPDSLDGTIRTLHASFPDFISTKSRCLPGMYVEPTPQHRVITIRLFEIMQDGLKPNMAYYIRFKLNKEDHFPACLRYACRFWADHLSHTNILDADELIQGFKAFVSTNLSHCLEALDSISKPSENLSETATDKAETWLAGLRNPPRTLVLSLKETRLLPKIANPEQNLFSLFGLKPDTRYAHRGYGGMCSDGTRNGVLEKILQWVNESSSQLFWLNGAAGTGKTTVAMTVADLLEMDRSKLTANFFCSRYSKYRRNVHHLFVTLSILLAARNTQYRQQLVKAVQRNPLVIQARPSDQFQILIVEPLCSAGLLRYPIVFVVDALDECRPREEDAPGKILTALLEHLHKVPFLKILLSTRPSPFISSAMNSVSWPSLPTRFNLHDVDDALVDADIRCFLFEALCTHASIVERLSPLWPPEDLLDRLVKKAGGHFLYASFIRQRFVLVGTQKLRDAADQQGSEYEGNLGLNLYYGRMLKWLIAGDDEKARHFKIILGLLAHLHTPVTAQQFEQLAGLSDEHLQLGLLELQPLVIVSDDDKRLMRLIHESVRHWLTDRERALPALFVDAREVHQSILLRLFECMLSKLNGDRRVSRLAMGDSRAAIDKHKMGLLDYACRYWAEHLMQTSATPAVQKALDEFLESKVLFWIERLDSLGSLMAAATALEKTRIWYHVRVTMMTAQMTDSLLTCKPRIQDVPHPRHECVKSLTDAQQLLMERSMMVSTH